MVWTHNMKNITYTATFVAQGSPANETYEGRMARNLMSQFISLTAQFRSCDPRRWGTVA